MGSEATLGKHLQDLVSKPGSTNTPRAAHLFWRLRCAALALGLGLPCGLVPQLVHMSTHLLGHLAGIKVTFTDTNSNSVHSLVITVSTTNSGKLC